MTSHLIDLFAKRASSLSCPSASASPPSSSSPLGNSSSPSVELRELTGQPEEECTFCEIVAGKQEAYKVYEDESVIAFLDILPIRPGHLLVVPKRHYERVSQLPAELSAEIGRTLPRISRALCRAVNQPDFNIVSNQGHAQVVPHVHYHLIPAPFANAPPPSPAKRLFSRNELDEEEGETLSRRIREELQKEETARSKL